MVHKENSAWACGDKLVGQEIGSNRWETCWQEYPVLLGQPSLEMVKLLLFLMLTVCFKGESMW